MTQTKKHAGRNEARARNRVMLAEKVAAESVFARAAAQWVANREGLDAHEIWGVDFAVARGGSCPTCEYTAAGIEYWRVDGHGDLHNEVIELPYPTATGNFIEECVALLPAGKG